MGRFDNYTDEARRIMMGDCGESLVKDYCNKHGHPYLKSEHRMDMDKDLYIPNKPEMDIEVKTQIPKHFGHDRFGRMCEVFTIPFERDSKNLYENQIRKCKIVPFLYHVRVPYYEMGDAIEIWLAPEPKDRHFLVERNSKNDTLSIPIREYKLIHVHRNMEYANILRDLTTAGKKWKHAPKHFYSEQSYE